MNKICYCTKCDKVYSVKGESLICEECGLELYETKYSPAEWKKLSDYKKNELRAEFKTSVSELPPLN